MIRRVLLIALLSILALFLIVILGSFVLLGTDSGFRWSSQKLESLIPGLTLTETSGNLESGISANSLHWQNDSVSVDVQNMESSWNSTCFVSFTYCLEKLSLGTVDITVQPAEASGGSSGQPVQLPTVKLPVAISAKEISIDTLKLNLSPDSAPIILKNLYLDADTSGSDISIRKLAGSWKQHALAVEGKITLDGDYPLELMVNLHSSELIAGDDVSAKLTLSGSLAELVLDGYTSGAVESNLAGMIQPLQPQLPLDLSLSWDRNGWPIDTHQSVLSSDANLTIEGTLADYDINLTTALSGESFPPLTLQTSGQVNPERALLPIINILTLEGYATGSAAVDWTQEITWIAELIAKEIDPGSHWADMSGDLNVLTGASGVVSGDQWSLAIDQLVVDGSLREFPFSLNTVVAKSLDNVWQVDNLTLNNGPNQLSVNGSYGAELDINAAVDFPAIHYLVPGAAGNLKADAVVTGSLEIPSVQLDASSSLIKLGQNLFREVTVETEVARAAQEPSTIKLNIGRLNANAQQFRNIRVVLDGILEEHGVSAAVSGPADTAVSLRATGQLDDDYNWHGRLNTAQVTTPAQTATLKSKPGLQWNQAEALFSIDPHCWDIESSSLCLQNTVQATASGSANLALSDYRLNKLNSLLPDTAALGGTLNATARIQWGDASESTSAVAENSPDAATPFKIDLDAAVSKGRVAVRDEGKTRHSFRFDSLQLKTRADPYTVSSDLTLRSKDLGNGELGLTLNPRNPSNNIAGELRLTDFDIGFLQAFLPAVSKIGGTVNVAGKLSGSLSEPEFNGNIDLLEPELESPDLPLTIDGGGVQAKISGQRATLDGKLKSGDGNIALNGNLSWLNQQPRARININGEALTIQQAPVTYALANPALRIDYSAARLGITGKVVVPSADINIRELPEGTTTLSGDVIIVEEIQEDAAEIKTSGPELNLKVDVELGSDVNLSGYGLEAKLSGNVSVAKRGEDPVQLGGEIVVSEGFYRSYGQDLTVNDGRILFVGPVERTTLNIDAVREIENEERIAGLHLEGNIRDPQVTLFTEPADKTQESILSYIVLGRDLGAGTDTDENQLLAAAALALTLKEGKGFATGFAESLGISDFSMTTGGSGDDTQVVVSGRLSSRLLLRYGRNVFDAEETLFLRYDISKKLYLEAARGVERAVDLFYSFSF